MFFSSLQTLTIPVNTVGAMGKGLAALAKRNFPHLYVRYEELCRRKILTTKRPYLERNPGAEKQFLLFATKEDWRKPSRLEYIEDGLAALVKRRQDYPMESLAMPALGCGLGGLSWGEVGPVMCRYLRELEIPCEIYLPREAEIPEEQLTAEFLLG